jgi:competence protein ComEC
MLSPAVLAAAPLLLGVVLGAMAPLPLPLVLLTVTASWVSAAAGLVRRRAFVVVAACACGCAGAGVAAGASATRAAAEPSILGWFSASPGAHEPVRLTGVLREDAAITPFGVGVVVDAESVRIDDEPVRIDGGVRAAIAGSLATRAADAWRQGRVVSVSGVLREPTGYRNIGVPDDRDRLLRDRIALLASVKSAALVQVLAPGAAYAEAAAAIRAHVRRAITHAVGRWSRQSAGVVTAILIGDRTGLDQDDERRLQEAGTYHVIAISGGNIALLTAVLVLTGRLARLSARTTYAASILLLTFYGYTAGLAPSVLRATLAAVVYLTARLIDHRGSAINALAVAAGCAAAFTPLSVLDPGFVLSFAATFAIVAAASRASPRIERQPAQARLHRTARAALASIIGLGAATLCAEIALLPVGARLFGRVSFAGLLLNFAAIPLMSLIQIAGLAAVVLFPVSHTAALVAGWFAHQGTVGLLRSAALVEWCPWLVLDVPSPSLIVIALWYGAAVVLVVWWPRRRVRFASASALVAAGLLIIFSPPQARAAAAPPLPDGWSRLAFIDVGQGDATVILPWGGAPLLVDAGGAPGSSFDLGRRVTLPAIWALGARRLGLLMLSHGDPDHIGGAPAVIRALRPGEIWEGIPVPGHAPLQRLHQLAADRGIAWRTVRTGERRRVGAASLRVMNPPDPDWQRVKVRNEDSIVLDVRIGDVEVLLPGDIGQFTERLLLPGLDHAPITIVKAPHHGSAGSSSVELITATHPAVVVFSAGRRNPFGHPAPAVVDRYRAAGTRVFRTDEDGEVIIDTDGRQVVVWTWSGRREWIK